MAFSVYPHLLVFIFIITLLAFRTNAQSTINEIDQVKFTSAFDGTFLKLGVSPLGAGIDEGSPYVTGNRFRVTNETHLFRVKREEVNAVAYTVTPMLSNFEYVMDEHKGENGIVVYQHKYHGQANQLWAFEEYPPGRNLWVITSLYSFKVLQSNGADQPVTLEEMNLESTRQRWIITYF